MAFKFMKWVFIRSFGVGSFEVKSFRTVEYHESAINVIRGQLLVIADSFLKPCMTSSF